MKVKEITLAEDTYEVTTKPMPGATSIEVGGQSVGTAKDPQTAQTVAQAAKDGKLSLTPPGAQGGNSGAQVQEEPSNSSNTVNAIQKGAQLFASDGDPIEITSTRREIDQAYIADPANAGNRMGYVVFKGKKYLALNTGHKWKIGPKAFAEITGIMHMPASRNPVPSTDSRSQPLPQLGQRPNPANMHKLEESAEVSRIKMLSGLK